MFLNILKRSSLSSVSTPLSIQSGWTRTSSTPGWLPMISKMPPPPATLALSPSFVCLSPSRFFFFLPFFLGRSMAMAAGVVSRPFSRDKSACPAPSRVSSPLLSATGRTASLCRLQESRVTSVGSSSGLGSVKLFAPRSSLPVVVLGWA